MKTTVIILSLFISLSAMQAAAKARYAKITAKTCDGEQQPVEENEVIMFDLSQSEIGMGVRENGCVTVDVVSTLTTKPRSKANPTVFMETVDTLGRRSTCASSALRADKSVNFQAARIKSTQVILKNTGSCKELVLDIQ